MTNDFYYAGIGSRETPPVILEEMRDLAEYLTSLGYGLRTGGADGADLSFEIGQRASGGHCEIWTPWKNFKFRTDTHFVPSEIHRSYARKFHPIYDKLPNYAQYLHARNVGIVLGENVNHPVKFVLCWTADGCEHYSTRTSKTGGTGLAIALASHYEIPIFNMKNPDYYERLRLYLDGHFNKPSVYNQFYDDYLRPELHPETIFVFGSNLAGRHGKGAALTAKLSYGAEMGVGEGLTGRSYAIPTKDENLNVLPLEIVKEHVNRFVEFTQQSSHHFYLTPVGTGLAGYSHSVIAPLFRGVKKCWIPKVWLPDFLKIEET